MPYQYLTFSDLYEEQVRSSAPSSPVMGASLSPVFLLPTTSSTFSSSAQASTSYHHHTIPSEPSSRRSSTTPARSQSYSHRRRSGDAHHNAMLKTLTQDSDDVAQPTSSPHLHLDFFKVFKRRGSSKTRGDSAFSTPASSRRSSFTSHGFAHSSGLSAASSANTSPAISRQVSRQATKLSDYEALVQRTAREEQDEENKRQQELRTYFNQAAETGLSLRRF